MKTKLLFRIHSSTLSVSIAVGALFGATSSAVHSASIFWGAPTTVVSDIDVSTTATLIEAANTGSDGNGAGATTTVNGVTFTGWPINGGAVAVSPGGHFSMAAATGYFHGSFNGFGSGVAPFSGLSSAYRTLLGWGNYSQSQSNPSDFTGALLLTINGLSIGTAYEFQWWTNDSRPFATGPVTATAGASSVSLSPNTTNAAGGVGQFAIGTFTADSTTQEIVFSTTGNGNLQNAFQLRGPPSISGTISYCSNPVPGPVPNVTLTLTGTASGSDLSDSSGNYEFSSLAIGGNYTVTPTKSALAPGSAGITGVDAVATQRHFLNLGTPLSGCRLAAADVTGNSVVDGVDAVAIQRFFLGFTSGIANVGKYKFTPASRSYVGIVSTETAQNFDALVFGDTASSFVERMDDPPPTEAEDGNRAGEVGPTVAAVALPEIAINQFRTPKALASGSLSREPSESNFIAAVRTTAIDANHKLIGFQGDLTFDERVVTFQSEPVQKAGITGGNWNVSGNVLPGPGPIRTLRISAYSNDFTPLSGSGTLFELRMTRVGQAAQSTHFVWREFLFIDADLKTQQPGNAAPVTQQPYR